MTSGRMFGTRSCGVLLHPTCLPGKWGIGTLGSEARSFAKLLQEWGQSVWQVLPLNPVGAGNSPYDARSTFAGNTLLVDCGDLIRDGLLDPGEAAVWEAGCPGRVDYASVASSRKSLWQTVGRTFDTRLSCGLRRAYALFREREAFWLEEYVLFEAIRQVMKHAPWWNWPRPLAMREPAALQHFASRYGTLLHQVCVGQFLFDLQWRRLRRTCARRGVSMLGDLPFYVAHDSADVWAHPELFTVNGAGRLTAQSGVPPDYFSRTGQLWGTPVYRWAVHQATGYAWWIQRMQRVFSLCDAVRIDHFRGFAAAWVVPWQRRTARSGRWVPGPGRALFDALPLKRGGWSILAENLGFITRDVERLRKELGFPGMRVLQFEPHLVNTRRPGKKPELADDEVLYTGTHDNDTLLGWVLSLPARRRPAPDPGREAWHYMERVLHSKANLTILPLQDILGLDSGARMNKPGTGRGNWEWRFAWNSVSAPRSKRLLEMLASAARI